MFVKTFFNISFINIDVYSFDPANCLVRVQDFQQLR